MEILDVNPSMGEDYNAERCSNSSKRYDLEMKEQGFLIVDWARCTQKETFSLFDSTRRRSRG